MNQRKRAVVLLLGIMLTVQATSAAEVRDDFSEPGTWQRKNDTPGELEQRSGRLLLRDAPGKPDWVTAVREFDVDLDATPVLNVRLRSATGSCEVKVIRGREKHSVLRFRTPGIHSCDLSKAPGWKGRSRIAVHLYAIGAERSAVFESVSFTATPELPPEKPVLELVPSFNACSYYWLGPEQAALAVEFREPGGAWKQAFPPVRDRKNGLYRGSIVELRENTSYDFRLTGKDGKTVANGSFRTWGSEIPVAKTVVLNEKNFNGSLKISERGRPDGWIRYTAAPGFILAGEGEEPLLELEDAAYVLLDGLTLKGGGRHAMTIRECSFVRVANCEISGWGRPGVQRFDLDGKYYDKAGKAINFDAGIHLVRSHGVVVERCYFHDPRTTANSWRYSHPAGPCGMLIDGPTSTVVRYNDLVGSDLHRWNDGIEGVGNFRDDGGFNRDADIYGNFIIFCSDDNIELDGGQQNVRCSYNRFEGAYCGVSVQGCMTGPSYVFRNLLIRPGDRFGTAGQTIKTSSPRSGEDAVCHIFHNTLDGDGSGLALLPHLKIIARNNIFSGTNRISRREKSPQSECAGNLLPDRRHDPGPNDEVGIPGFAAPERGVYTLRPDSPVRGGAVTTPNFAEKGEDPGAFQAGAAPVPLPFRPIPVELDCGTVDFGEVTNEGGSRTVTATVGGKDFSAPFRVRQNEAFDWFEVTPETGTLRSGETVRFTVRLLPEKMEGKHRFRGAFQIRLADGFSRPVSVYADMPGFRPETRPEAGAVYRHAADPDAGHRYPVFEDPAADGGRGVRLEGERGVNAAEYRFEIPEGGKYQLMVRIRSERPVPEHDSIFCAVDEEPLREAHLNSRDFWLWSPAAPGEGSFGRLKQYDLAPGVHTVRIAPREPLNIDLIAFVRDPGKFPTD